MKRMCLACKKRRAVTTEDYTPLCERCLDRAGLPVKKGQRVICVVTHTCSGTVHRIEDDYAVIATEKRGEAWVPIGELIKVVG